jgi:hypothetical protein
MALPPNKRVEPTAPAGVLKIVGFLKITFPIYRCDPDRGGGSRASRWAAAEQSFSMRMLDTVLYSTHLF